MLQARNLTCMRGDRRLFSGVEFSLDAGGLLRLGGANGAGKTSLQRLVCGLAQPEEGDILWRGKSIRSQRDEYHREMLFLGHASAVKDELSALENLQASCSIGAVVVPEDVALQALARMGLAGREDLPAKVLSQGQRRRVALARLLLSRDVPLWVLDEPFTALDVAAVADLCTTIGGHLACGGMVVFTTHQDVAIDAVSYQRLDLNGAGAC